MRAIILATLLWLLSSGWGLAQIPVEIFTGHEKATLDILFFRFFQNREGQNSRWLFFNRTRASVDYRQTRSTYLPQSGFTEAVSFNSPAWKGVAPVFVGQVLGRGVFPKAGLQYAHARPVLTVFGWAVCELLENPAIDFFLLLRYTPRLGARLHGFVQLELFNSFPTSATQAYSFTQRYRLGLKQKAWQFGLGADAGQTGRKSMARTTNAGFFLRHEF